MDKTQARREIRSRIKCTEFLERSAGGLYCCPVCGSGRGKNRTGAVKYYPETNTWHCFSCSAGTDIIDLYRQATGKEYAAALHDLAAKIGIDIDPGRAKPENDPQNRPRIVFCGREDKGGKEQQEGQQGGENGAAEATADYTAYYKECKDRLNAPEAAGYLQSRGITKETAAAFWIGYDPKADPINAPGAMGDERRRHPLPRIIIPTGPGHYIARRIDGKSGFEKLNPKGSTAGIFNARALYEAQEVFITEGAFDALSLIEAGAAAAALNSATNARRLIEQLEQRKTAATLILCLDNDESGKRASAILEEGLQRLKIPHITAEICAGHKDPNEAFTADREAFCAAIEQAQREARERAGELQEAARREERERQQRTGAGMVDYFLQEIKTRKYERITTGIEAIDCAIGGGFIRQQLVLLGAAPGAGKTAFAQWIFERMAESGTTCLFLNLEMSRAQLLARSISRIAAQNGAKVNPAEVLQGYNWTPEQEQAITKAAEGYKRQIAPRIIYNPEGAGADLDRILDYIEAEAIRAEEAGEQSPCVVLDYLQILSGKPREDEAGIVKRAVSSLKSYAMRHNTIAFAIIAHNREANKSGTVTMESGRDTSALEYSADLQLGLAFTKCLNRPGIKGKAKDELTQEERKYITLKVTKGRFTAPGTETDLYFNGETMTYSAPPAEPRDGRQRDTSSYIRV